MKLPLRILAVLTLAVLGSALYSCNSGSNTPTAPPSGGGGTPVANASVTAQGNNTFSPSVVNLLAGGTMTFSNGSGLHNVNAQGGVTFRCANGCDGQGGSGEPSTSTWSFAITFPSAGTTNYVCDEHASVGMAGSIIVQ
jgi:plastocyanin